MNYGESLSIDFQQCENYKAQLEQEQKDKIERMKRRYNAIQSLPAYMRNPKESLALKLATDAHYREQLGIKIGAKNSGGANPRMIGWSCPSCGRSDATYLYKPIGKPHNRPMWSYEFMWGVVFSLPAWTR